MAVEPAFDPLSVGLDVLGDERGQDPAKRRQGVGQRAFQGGVFLRRRGERVEKGQGKIAGIEFARPVDQVVRLVAEKAPAPLLREEPPERDARVEEVVIVADHEVGELRVAEREFIGTDPVLFAGLAEQGQVDDRFPRGEQFARRVVLAGRRRARERAAFRADLAADQPLRADPFLRREKQALQIRAVFGEPLRRVAGGEGGGVLRRQVKDLVAMPLSHRANGGKENRRRFSDPGGSAGVERIAAPDRPVRRRDQLSLPLAHRGIGEDRFRHRGQPTLDPFDLGGGVAFDRLKQPVVEPVEVALRRGLAFFERLARRRQVDGAESAAGSPGAPEHREKAKALAARLPHQIRVGSPGVPRERDDEDDLVPVERNVARDEIAPTAPLVQVGDRLGAAFLRAVRRGVVGQGTRPPTDPRQPYQFRRRDHDRPLLFVVAHRVPSFPRLFGGR